MRSLSALLMIVVTSAAWGHDRFSDSGIYGPPYADIVATMDELASSSRGWLTVTTYGRSVDGKDLKVVKIENPDADRRYPRPAVLISGATHGNEYLNIADRLPDWFLRNRERSPGLSGFFSANGALYVVPILNPDGYDARRRANANGRDLNRDFELIPLRIPNFQEPETRELAVFLEQDLADHNLILKVTVDYHCCDGSLLYPWSYSRDALPPYDLEAHRVIARLMQEHINGNYQHGSTGQVLGYYPKGTSKDYYYAKYGALAYTFEGTYRREDQNFEKHTVWWDRIFALLASGGTTR